MVQRDVQRMVQGGAYCVVAAVAEILWGIQALGHFKFRKCGKDVFALGQFKQGFRKVFR